LNAISARGVTLDSGLSYAGISIFANAANTRTDGLEATATYSSDFEEYGHVDWSLGFNYNKTDITKLDALPATVTNAAFGQTALLNAAALSGLTDSTPREKAILQAYWTFHQWSVNLRETIYGSSSEMTSFNGSGEGLYAFKETIPATGITDLEIAYRVTPQIKLSVGANNLFNQFPPTTPNRLNGTTLEPVNGALVWNVPYSFSPYGINGGYYYGRVTFTF
jgi:iron complex outermembrane receptor protein